MKNVFAKLCKILTFLCLINIKYAKSEDDSNNFELHKDCGKVLNWYSLSDLMKSEKRGNAPW
jgi:hypothetical protein